MKYLNERRCWQDNTLKYLQTQIEEKTGADISDDVILYGRDKFIITYGIGDVCRLLLIFKVLGLKPEYKDKAYSVIKKSIPEEKQKSVFVMYGISDDNRYGTGVFSIQKETLDITYFDENTAEEKIGTALETAGDEDVVYIYLPLEFFEIDEENGKSISVLDIPAASMDTSIQGNRLRRLMGRFLAVADVVSVVCDPSGTNIEHPCLDVDWQTDNGKYIITVLDAFNNDDVRSYLKKDRAEREDTFYNYIRTVYSNIITCDAETGIGVTVFPVSINDISEELTDDSEDIEEIKSVDERIIKEILISINNRSAVTLDSDVKFLFNRLKKYFKKRNEDNEQKYIDLQNEKQELDEEIRKENAAQQVRLSGNEPLENDIKMAQNIIKNLERITEYSEEDGDIDYINIIKKYLWMPEVEMISYIKKESLESFTKDIFEAIKAFALRYCARISAKLPERMEITIKIEDSFEDTEKELKLLENNMSGMAERRKKQFEEVIENYLDGYKDKLRNKIIFRIKLSAEAKAEELKEKLKEIENNSEPEKKTSNEKELRFKQIDVDMEQNRKNIDVFKENEEYCRNVLKDYFGVAEIQYGHQYNTIVKRLDTDSESEKELKILLALIERDFNIFKSRPISI